MRMSDWKDIHHFFTSTYEHALTPSDRLIAKKGIVKSLFRCGQLSDILTLCSDEIDSELQEYRICTQFALCQFQSVYEEMHNQQIHFNYDLKRNTFLELKKSYYLSLSTILTLLCDKEDSKAIHFIKYVQSLYYENYTNQLKHNKSNYLPSQVYLFIMNELSTLLTGTNPQVAAYHVFSHLNQLVEHHANSDMWSDVFTFRKFVHFLYPSVKLSNHLMSISGRIQIPHFIEELKTYYDSTPHSLPSCYTYTFAKLLYHNHRVEEAVHVIKQLKSSLMRIDNEVPSLAGMENQEYIVRCSNRLLKWNACKVSEQELIRCYHDVLDMPQIAMNYKIYCTLTRLYSQIQNPTDEFVKCFVMIVTNALMLVPERQSISQLDLLHHYIHILNTIDDSFSSLINAAFVQIPISSFHLVINTLIDYGKIAETKWGVDSFQYSVYRKYLIYLAQNEHYLASIITQLQHPSLKLYQELFSVLIESKPQSLHSILHLAEEMRQLVDNKLGRFYTLFHIRQPTEFSVFAKEYSEIWEAPNLVSFIILLHPRAPLISLSRSNFPKH